MGDGGDRREFSVDVVVSVSGSGRGGKGSRLEGGSSE